ncbi:MAG: DUF4260 family protein [Chloroflexi bacterium]|nr:DUF4260 family protein [Chloroflexota bacterium]
MKNPLRREELLMFFLALLIFLRYNFSWDLFAPLFFTPAPSVTGYLTNSRLGAWTYTLIHRKGLGITLYGLSPPTDPPLVELHRHSILRPLQR